MSRRMDSLQHSVQCVKKLKKDVIFALSIMRIYGIHLELPQYFELVFSAVVDSLGNIFLPSKEFDHS